MIKNTYLIESKISGLGKTYTAERIKPNSKIVYFPISGTIDFSGLIDRLKSKKLD